MIISGSRRSGKTHYAISNLVDDNTLVLVDDINCKRYINMIKPNVKVLCKNHDKLINYVFLNNIKRVIVDEFSLSHDFNLLSLQSMGFELVLILRTERVETSFNDEKIYFSR